MISLSIWLHSTARDFEVENDSMVRNERESCATLVWEQSNTSTLQLHGSLVITGGVGGGGTKTVESIFERHLASKIGS